MFPFSKGIVGILMIYASGSGLFAAGWRWSRLVAVSQHFDNSRKNI